jgi:prophage maintenance system killer protein/prophage antirepressor-like protein
MTEIVIYTAKDGHIKLDVNLADNSIWLSQQQIADLFGTKRPAITKHLKNIFNSNELTEDSVCSILERAASDGKKYKTKFYNLDAIVSVGYRVNSHQATQFRIWATQVLKEHLVRGYTTYKKRLAEKGLKELQQTVELLKKTLIHNELVNNLGQEAIQLILTYAKTWDLLLAYDEGKLKLPAKAQETRPSLNYQTALSAIESLKIDLSTRNEATHFFGQENGSGLDNILKNIEQTFGGECLYKTAEEKAAHLLYFVIKDHPFTDGNKRIGSFMFLLYLKSQHMPLKLNENGLVALALLIAESDPKQKELIIKLIVNLLMD